MIPLPDSGWRRRFRRALVDWYGRHARDLPWRRTRDPYAVWVSEIMLQQTQVATVEPYFERFLAALPDIAALAAADEDEVLRLWEGLGYYRRARQMHQAARKIVAEHDGGFPRDAAALRALPGIGRYTAGAILSIAFDAREPILEANATRVLSRLLAYREDPSRPPGQRLLWSFAAALVPRRNAGTFNQALMELGSTVCLPRAPHCDRCPAKRRCPTREAGLQDAIPPPAKKTRYERRHEAAVVVRRDRLVLVRRCGEDERWAGLWDFPRFAIAAPRPDVPRRELVERVRERTGILIEPGERIAVIKHGVTRFRITLTCHEATYVSGAPSASDDGSLRWVMPAELERLPLSVTGRRIGRLLAGVSEG